MKNYYGLKCIQKLLFWKGWFRTDNGLMYGAIIKRTKL